MEKEFYLAKVDMTYTVKNKLQEAIKNYILSLDRIIIPASELNNFKINVVIEVNKFKAEYPKCKYIDVEWWAPNEDSKKHSDWGLSFGGHTIVVFWLYAGVCNE